MKGRSNEVFMQGSLKRQKTAALMSASPQMSAKYIMMSPVLSLIMQVLMNDALIDNDWKVR